MIRNLLFAGALLFAAPSFAQFSGNALDFDGADDMVVCSTVPAMFSNIATNDITIEAWVHPRGSAFQRIFFAQPSTTNFVSLGTNTGNTIYFYVIRNSTTYSVATTSSITQNAWTHVAARWTSATNAVEVFFNGVQQPTTGGGSSSTGTSGLMVVGSRPGGAQYFNGMVDELRVWNEARTNCEISNNYMHSITGVQTNLIVNYDFNQGVAAGNNTGIITLPDNSGNAFNGTLTNFTLTGTTSNWLSSAATLTTQGNPLGGIIVPQSAAICSGSSFTFPDGTTLTNITSTAAHTSTLTAANGCDSIINTTVYVSPVYAVNDSARICYGMDYTFPDGTSFIAITSPMSHTSSLTAITGCDSIVTTYLDLNPVYSTPDTAYICTGGSYTFPDGTTMTNISAPMSHISTLSSINSCDSLIDTYIDLYPVYATSDSFGICYGSSFTFADGMTINGITANMAYTSLLSSINGCDSVITTTIGIISVDTMVTMLNETLTANAPVATYQWLDCNNGFAPMAGETNQSFTATVNGSYALAITENGCTDTSSCFLILSTGINSNGAVTMSVFPNPADEAVTVQTNQPGVKQVEIISLTGETVQSFQFSGTSTQVPVAGLAPGTYVVKLSTENGVSFSRIQKH